MGDVRRKAQRVSSVVAFGVLPAAFLALFVVHVPRATYAWDFHAFWHAAHAVVHGGNPYSSGGFNADGQPIPAYVYPPILAELISPLGWLPFLPAAVVFIVVSAAAMIGAIWVVGVRDWRCFGAAFLWFPTLHALRLGALTPCLALALAIVVRFERRRTHDGALAVAIGSKLFLWPLWMWELARRGFLALVRSVSVTAALVLVSWAVVGFDGLDEYPKLLRATEHQWLPGGYGVATALHGAGLSAGAVTASLLPLALLASTSTALLWRTGRIGDGEALALFVVAAILLSPVMWLHYAALLVVPIAVLTPRFGAAWCVPLLFWASPSEESHGAWWRLVLGIGSVVLTVGVAILQARARARASAEETRGPAAVVTAAAPA